MTASVSPSKKPAGIGWLVAAGMVPGIAWLLVLLLGSRVDADRCDSGPAQSTRGFGVSAEVPLTIVAVVAIVLTIVAAIVLVRWWRLARQTTGKSAGTRAFLAVSSLVALGLFVPLAAASVVEFLARGPC